MYWPPQKLYPHGLAGAPQVFLTGGGLWLGDGLGRGDGFGDGNADGEALATVAGEVDCDVLGLGSV